NAVSIAAARTKGIVSDVAGQADVLVVPDLESGNMLAKQVMYMGEAASAGIVMGAKVPVVLTSRADSRESRLASCAIALMLAHRYRTAPPEAGARCDTSWAVACGAFGRTQRPVGRGSLFARSAHPCAGSRAKHPCFACRDPRPPVRGSARLSCVAPSLRLRAAGPGKKAGLRARIARCGRDE